MNQNVSLEIFYSTQCYLTLNEPKQREHIPNQYYNGINLVIEYNRISDGCLRLSKISPRLDAEQDFLVDNQEGLRSYKIKTSDYLEKTFDNPKNYFLLLTIPIDSK